LELAGLNRSDPASVDDMWVQTLAHKTIDDQAFVGEQSLRRDRKTDGKWMSGERVVVQDL